MNQGMYGYGLPPNYATRVAPPRFSNQQMFLVPGTSTFTVPQNVYQIYALVVGAGGSGGVISDTNAVGTATGGGGGGFAAGFIDVTPGQIITGIVVGTGGAASTRSTAGSTAGTAGGTSSVGTFLTATGGGAGQVNIASSTTAVAGGTGGTGTSGLIRGSVTSSGGAGGAKGTGTQNGISTGGNGVRLPLIDLTI